MKMLFATFCTLPFNAYVAPLKKSKIFFAVSVSIFSRLIITGLLPFKLSTNFGHSSKLLGSITTSLNVLVPATEILL